MSIITSFDQNFTLLRNADVNVLALKDSKNRDIAKIVVGNQFEHTFDHKSGVSRSLVMGPDKVQEHLKNGTFFFHDKELVSYRGANFKGFTHTDESIEQLIQHIGFSSSNQNRSAYRSTSSENIRLMNEYSKVEMQIEQFQTGGEMDSRLSFQWDPFQSHIRAVFQLVRLICENGMTGMSDFMNAKIPVISDWIEHMEIANAQIQNKVTSMVRSRMSEMSTERASVRDCQRIVDACHTRLNDVTVLQTPSAVERIRNIALVADPHLHLSNHYSSRVMADRRLSDQASSHLTEFTAWNMLTELATHTDAVSSNSETALHKHANELLIDRHDNRKTCARSNTLSQNVEVKFDDLDAAFAGDLITQS